MADPDNTDQPAGSNEAQESSEKPTPDPPPKSSSQPSMHEDVVSQKSKTPSTSEKEVKVDNEEVAEENAPITSEKPEEIEPESTPEPDKGGKKKKDKKTKAAGDEGDTEPKKKGKSKKEKKSAGSEQSLGKGKKGKGKKEKKVESATDEDIASEEEKNASASKSSVKDATASRSSVKDAAASKSSVKDATASRSSVKDGAASKSSVKDAPASKSSVKDASASAEQVTAAKSSSGTTHKKREKKKEKEVSEVSLGRKKKAKKKQKEVSEVSVGKKKKGKKKQTETSDVSLGRKKKGKKKQKASQVGFEEVEDEKKKDKKVKTRPSIEPHLVDEKTARTPSGHEPGSPGSPISPTKKPSRSRTSLTRTKSSTGKSKPSLVQLMSRLSLHAVEMEKLRSKLTMSLESHTSLWTLGSSGSSDSETDDDKTVGKKSSSKTVKKKKKQKDKKGKRKKSSEPSETDVSEEPAPKKKKKGKRLKIIAEEEPATVVEPEVDVLAEIAKMKYLAELQASGEETEPTTDAASVKKQKKKKKRGPKKKLSKKEKARLAAEAAEKARVNAEEEAAKAAELERIRLEEERKAAIEKERREGFEQQIRMEQLEAISEQFADLVAFNRDLRANAKAQAEWEFYVNCGRLPNPSKCDQMNTFLHLWENVVQETSMEEAARRTIDVLELLNELDDLVDTAEKKDNEVVENWKWVRLLFRQQQAKSLDVATYRLLRNIEKNLNRIDIPTADYKYQDDNIALCLWLRIQLPTPLPNPRRPPKPRIEVNFPEMKMEVQFPLIIDGEKVAVRALYVKYDHLSDLSDSYEKPPTPEQYDIDLYNSIKIEWKEKLLYKYNNRVRKTPPPSTPNEELQEGEEPKGPPPELVIGLDDEIPIVPYRKLEPTASEYVIAHEDELYGGTRTELIKAVPEDVINLRKYSVIGGVYNLNLLHQPPQPQDFVTLEMNLTPLYLPKELDLVDLYLEYQPPIPPDATVKRPPEEIEEEMKRLDEELEKLILVTLTWPDHVIFLELPMVCYWDDERRVWSKNEVHDLKHNEEKGQLSFRTRKGAIFALAVYRYANLPYQAWEMRPELNGSISLQITAAILMVEFNIKDGLIALSQLQNSPNNALQDIVGTHFPLPKLIRILQSAGVDVFPAFDAFCYIESSCEKHWPMEKQLYFNMAQLGICFNFAWSRWNMPAGRRSIILQMREYNLEKTKQKSHLMMHVTPLSALYVDCTEVSQTFNEEGIENMKFYPDLFHLMKGTCSMAVKNKIAKASKELIFALYELLIATRVVSFS